MIVGLLGCVVAWFIIPASTYIEDVLGVLMLVFGAMGAIGGITHYVAGLRKKP
jgi:hypothetical protein